MVKHTFTLFVVLFVLTTSGIAAGDVERDRKARVALALSATQSGPTVAPAPRVVTLPNYAEAYRRAVGRGEPLVLYVGCDGRHPIERIPNAVVGVTAELAGYDPGTVVIAYPREGRVFVHVAVRCPDHGESVVKSVQEARMRIVAPSGKSEEAPVPLNWDVRASR